MKQNRPKIGLDIQTRVFFNDGWLCRWCRAPVVFAPTFRLLEGFVKESGPQVPLAYFHPNWSRRSAPLLDRLGAVVDHVEAYSKGGFHGEANFVTACNKCNAMKNDRKVLDHVRDHPLKAIRGKHGEPRDWDGLVALFLVLADRGITLTPSERRWAQAFRRHLGRATV